MNRELKEFVMYKALGIKHSAASIIDMEDCIGEDGKIAVTQGSESSRMEVKNVCAKLPVILSDRLENTVKYLDIRKRRFIEMAIIQALDDADEVLSEVFTEDWIDSNRTDKDSE